MHGTALRPFGRAAPRFSWSAVRWGCNRQPCVEAHACVPCMSSCQLRLLRCTGTGALAGRIAHLTPPCPQDEEKGYSLSCAQACIASSLRDLGSYPSCSSTSADALGLVQLLAEVAPALSNPEWVAAVAENKVRRLVVPCYPLPSCLKILPSHHSSPRRQSSASSASDGGIAALLGKALFP